MGPRVNDYINIHHGALWVLGLTITSIYITGHCGMVGRAAVLRTWVQTLSVFSNLVYIFHLKLLKFT